MKMGNEIKIVNRKLKMRSNCKIPEIQSAHAVLLLSADYVLQLRDNKPTIAETGKWSLFGGKIKMGETPLETIRREVHEELSIKPAEYIYLWFTDRYLPFYKTYIRIWFFASDVTKIWSNHKLREGEKVKVFRFEELCNLDMPEVIRLTLKRFHRNRKGIISII